MKPRARRIQPPRRLRRVDFPDPDVPGDETPFGDRQRDVGEGRDADVPDAIGPGERPGLDDEGRIRAHRRPAGSWQNIMVAGAPPSL
jgi:hypothetical protein